MNQLQLIFDDKTINWFKVSIIFFLLIGSISSSQVFANHTLNSNEPEEVYLAFRYRGIISTVVISYYQNDEFYLPISEVFNLFQLENNIKSLEISGNFSTEQIPYYIDFVRNSITFGDERYSIDKDDYVITELDFYLKRDLLGEIFGLNFEVDFNTLSLNFETIYNLPIVENALRNQRRRIIANRRSEIEFYDLLDQKDTRFIDLGFLDYSFSTILNKEVNSFNYNTALGVKLGGGDLQGSFFGNVNNNMFASATDNLRWQQVYVNGIVKKLTIGQSKLDGTLTNPFTGIKITNEPIEPRRFFDEFEISGLTLPESEVELYVNNSLYDFQQTNSDGRYRFLTPVFYGASNIDIRIFGPTGQVFERSRRIQVPFSLIPEGELNYTLNAGRLDNPFIGATENSNVVQSIASYGITNWLTGKIGYEYFDGNTLESNSYISTSLSSRLFSNYILSYEGIYQNYFRTSLNVVYPNSSSINLDYTKFTNKNGIYNLSNLDTQLISNFSLPIRLRQQIFNLRYSSFIRTRDNVLTNSYRLELNTRFNSLNIRTGISDQQIDFYSPVSAGENANIEVSVSYNTPRSEKTLGIFKSTFFRGQMRYLPESQRLNTLEFLVSKNITSRGRLQLSFGRNELLDFNSVRFNLVFDFNSLRSNSTVTTVRDIYTYTQNVRGSIGFDNNYNNYLFTSRNQVGRSGLAVQMYVDANSNQIYDEDEEIIEGASLRLGRGGTSAILENDVLYYTQMQPNFRYNLEINKGSIRNPMLVAAENRFSIITTPNSFVKLNIPFYLSGVMEGVATRQYESGNSTGIGGLKLILESDDKEYRKEIRTFSDGSFYEYELAPNDYNIRIDSTQLVFLNSYSEPAVINFEVEALAEGDFVEGLNFTILPRAIEELDEEAEIEAITIAQVTDEIRAAPEILEYSEETFNSIDDALRLIIQAQNAFYSKNIDVAFRLVTESLELFETAQGHALKGSFYYFEGNIEQAQRHWEQALRFNPDLFIPDMETLEERVTTSASG